MECIDRIMRSDKVSNDLKRYLATQGNKEEFDLGEIRFLIVLGCTIGDSEDCAAAMPDVLETAYEEQREKRKYMLPETKLTIEAYLTPSQFMTVLSDESVERIERSGKAEYFQSDSSKTKEAIKEQFSDYSESTSRDSGQKTSCQRNDKGSKGDGE